MFYNSFAFFPSQSLPLSPFKNEAMPSVSQETIGTYHEKITVKLSKDDYMPAVDKALKKYSKDANIPGFRKGMVPVGIIRKMYGQSVFADEVLGVAGRALEQHLIENKAEIFARPLPASNQEPHNFDINQPTDYTFEFEIGTRPAFTIPLVEKKQTMPYYKVIVSHDMLQEEIEKLQYKAGDMQEADDISSENNVLSVTFDEITADGANVEGGVKKENSFLLKYFTPALQSKLFGKKKDDIVTFGLREAFDEKMLPAILNDLGLANEDANKDKHFQLTITKLELIDPAPLTKETFEKIYPGRNLETETEFKDVLTEEIQRYWDGQAQIRLHNEIFETLVHETPITMPVDFLKRWMSVGGEQYVAPEEVEKSYGSFDHHMRWQLISEQLVKQYGLEVEDEELEAGARRQIMSYFSSYGQMPSFDDEWMEPLVKKQLADTKFRDELYNKIMTDKLFYVLEQELKLEEKHVSLEEFVKLPSAHHHHH